MTAEVILQRNVRYDQGGKPIEVVIPYRDFVDFVETYGLDLTPVETQDIKEARQDLADGRAENFISAAEAKRELGL